MLGVSPNQSDIVRASATAPLILGGLGLRSAVRTSESAYWASWADCIPMMRERHPEVAIEFVTRLEAGVETQCLGRCRDSCPQPGWHPRVRTTFMDRTGTRGSSSSQEPDVYEPRAERLGWQHKASSRVELQFRELQLMPGISEGDRTLMRSQNGSGAGVAFSTTPCTPLTRLWPQLLRVLLWRSLRLPLPFSRRFCRCGRLLDALGHHRAACARAGVLGRRGFALESAAARICREAGGRVTTNIFVRDLDITAPNALDSHRLEVAAHGLPLFGGAQLAVDTTMVSPLRGDGSPHWGASERDSVVLVAARRRKERTCPELTASKRRTRLVVLAMEVGGRWSLEALTFTSFWARVRERHEPNLMRKRVEQALRMRR